MVKVSVIIPVYNTGKYLEECLDSIINQSLEDIEIICVDDGSTDSSPDILKEYADRDGRIRIITQHNQGLGASRNNGLKEAIGDYIYFIDSDDYLDLSGLEKLYSNAISNGSDIVLFKFQTFDDNMNVHTRGVEFKIDEIFGDIDYENFTFTYRQAERHVLNSAFSACLKLYRREFIDSFDFYFDEGISFEDVPVHAKVMLEASRISFVPEALYYYRSNPQSILNSTASGFDMLEIVDRVEDYLRQSSHFEELRNRFIFFKVAQLLKYMLSTRSDEYFERVKGEFLDIDVEGVYLSEFARDGYDNVLKSESLDEYIDNHYDKMISGIDNENRALAEENRKLEETNGRLMNSNSWKVTKPLRAINNNKK